MMQRYSVSEHADTLAAYLPNGRTFEAKNKAWITWTDDRTPVKIIERSNLRQLLEGLAAEFKRSQDYLADLNDDYIPDETFLFLDDWEQALGIPDGCFSGAGAIVERQRDVLVKLASLGVQTLEDFVELAALFGVTATITTGYDEMRFPLTFPIVLFNYEKDARYTLVVKLDDPTASKFPLTFPITFGSDTGNVLECLFNRLKPAYAQILFR